MKPSPENVVLLLGGSLDDTLNPPQAPNVEFALDMDLPISSEDEADIRIEEAILSLARACFARRVPLMFRDDPMVTPLVLEVALAYGTPPPAEVNDTGRDAALVWILANEQERVDSTAIEHRERFGMAQLMESWSLTQMPFSRAVCIGGGSMAREDIEEVLRRNARGRVFAIPSTGGTANSFYGREGVQDPEGLLLDRLRPLRMNTRFNAPDFVGQQEEFAGQAPLFCYSLYPLLMDSILGEELFPLWPWGARGGIRLSRKILCPFLPA
jgi:hypothetical protein